MNLLNTPFFGILTYRRLQMHQLQMEQLNLRPRKEKEMYVYFRAVDTVRTIAGAK
jgi:hypothetical protein